MMKWLRLLVPFIIFGFLFYRSDITTLVSTVTHGDWKLLGIAIIVSAFLIVAQGARWFVLSRHLKPRPTFWRLQRINFAAMAFDAFIPGKLGSDTYRIFQTGKDSSKTAALAVLIFLRLQTVFVGAVVAGVAYAYWGLGVYLGTILLITTLILLLSYLTFRVPVASIFGRVLEILSRGNFLSARASTTLRLGKDTVVDVLTDARMLLESTAVLVIFIFFNIIIFYVVAIAFHCQLPFVIYLVSVPVLLFASNFPLTVQGRGVTELLALYFWREYGATTEEVLVVCLAVYGVALLHSATAALALYLTDHKIKEQVHLAPEVF